MDRSFYQQLADQSIAQQLLPADTARAVLSSKEIELLPLLNAAYEVRKKFTGKEVAVHILNNAQNGYCPEDCHYCAQSESSDARIEKYPLKPDREILAEAKEACAKGAHRYCMVFAGRGPSLRRVEHLARLVRDIKSKYPIEVCVSAGLLDEEKARILKAAGLDRLNHNLNTSARHYPKICTTHTYAERLNTLRAARRADLQICSGVILGMGEDAGDVLEMAYRLSSIAAESIPVNFFIPIPGTRLCGSPPLSPEYCLRVLCLYRFLNPKAEIRIAAGREQHLRSLEAMALYPANSLFLEGYLNAKGAGHLRTFQMIKDAGFTITSEHSLDEFLSNTSPPSHPEQEDGPAPIALKNLKDLRPQFTP